MQARKTGPDVDDWMITHVEPVTRALPSWASCITALRSLAKRLCITNFTDAHVECIEDVLRHNVQNIMTMKQGSCPHKLIVAGTLLQDTVTVAGLLC
jgi:hypothetical protein